MNYRPEISTDGGKSFGLNAQVFATKEEAETMAKDIFGRWMAATDYRNKLDYANRKQDEADKANMESDAALAQLEDAIAAIGFVITPLAATEKEPELVITDWRQLKVGDLVEITTTRDGVNIGEAATIIAIDENNEYFRVTVTFPGDKYPLEYSYERPPTTWRFIRRP